MTTRRPFRALSVLVAGIVLCVPVTAAELPPPDEVRARLKTVAVMPLLAPDVVPNQAVVQQRIEQAIEERLTAAGLTVIPATAMREIQSRFREALGGYYDPHKGRVDEARAKAFTEHTETEFRRLHEAGAWLYPRVVHRRAFAKGPHASWDGVQESSTGAEGGLKKTFGAPQVVGQLPALSLVVVLFDPIGDPLYGRRGALQLLEYFEATSFGAQLFGGGSSTQYVPVDPGSIMVDPAREQRAISLALDPLLLTEEQREAAKAANEAAWDLIRPAPAGRPPADTGSVDRESFLASYPNVAVAAVDVPEIPNAVSVRARYGETVAAALTRAGFHVVPQAEYALAWDSVYAASGGFFDPITGELLRDKRVNAIRDVIAKLRESGPADAIFFPAIVVRDASIEKGKAEWDGASVALSGKKGGGLFDKSRSFGGTIPAASLELRAVDADGSEVFLGRGGIELLARFEKGGLLSGGTFKDIPAADWLGDSEVDTPATERALGALMPPP